MEATQLKGKFTSIKERCVEGRRFAEITVDDGASIHKCFLDSELAAAFRESHKEGDTVLFRGAFKSAGFSVASLQRPNVGRAQKETPSLTARVREIREAADRGEVLVVRCHTNEKFNTVSRYRKDECIKVGEKQIGNETVPIYLPKHEAVLNHFGSTILLRIRELLPNGRDWHQLLSDKNLRDRYHALIEEFALKMERRIRPSVTPEPLSTELFETDFVF